MTTPQHDNGLIGMQLLKSAQMRLALSQSSLALTSDVMDPETLVTFLYTASPLVRAVELLGSWDSFKQPYRMHHDQRRGIGFWTGCFKFDNIVFDGEFLDLQRPRSGGLKQGGTYWYFFRLNDEVEAYDSLQAYTSCCPLLPGQTVNVMDVPREIVTPPSRAVSASADLVGTLTGLPATHTLEPSSKFAVLEPPPVCKVHKRCVSDLALNGRLESQVNAPPITPPESRLASNGPTSSADVHAPRVPVDMLTPGSSVLPSRRSRRSSEPSPLHAPAVPAKGTEWLTASDGTVLGDETEGSYVLTRNTGSYFDPRSSRLADDHAISSTGRSALNRVHVYNSHRSPRASDPSYRSQLPSSPEPDPHRSKVSQPHQLSSSRPSTHALDKPLPALPFSSTPASPPTASPYTPSNAPNLDFSSPTFSASTISSAGVNTPFRLSAASSRHPAAYLTEDSVEQVTYRLHSLHTTEVSTTSPTYALPRSKLEEQSLAKASPHDSSGHAALLPLPSMQYAQEQGSLSDAIFSELGYLGGSIT